MTEQDDEKERQSSDPTKVVNACQLRDEYVERLMEMVTSSHWNKMTTELSTILDVLKLSTVQLVEAVCEWRSNSVFPFVWNGENILLRVASDLDFLEERRDLARWISLPSLLRNPFLQVRNLDDVAEKLLERREPLGIAAESFPMSTRIAAASWVILDEERMHGRFVRDFAGTVRDKLRLFREDRRLRQFLRRSEWSTRKQLNRMLKARQIRLNAIEIEWLGQRVRRSSTYYTSNDYFTLELQQVRVGQDDPISGRVDHRKMWKFLTSKSKSPASKLVTQQRKRNKKSSSSDWLMPEWESVKARREVKRVNAEIKSLRSSIEHAESEISNIEKSLEDMSEHESAEVSTSPSHAVLWRRNQLFRQKIRLETQRDKLKMRLQIAETQIRQLEAHDAMAKTVVRGRKVLEEDGFSETDKRMSADEKLKRFRRADREHRDRIKKQEHRQRKEEMEREIRERKKESKDAIRRALKYKAYLKSKQEKWREHATRAADVARAAANNVSSVVMRVDNMIHELRLQKEQETIKGIVILRRDEVMIPIESGFIACRVVIYDDCIVDDEKHNQAQSSSTQNGVMTLSLPKSSGITVAVIPDMKNEKNRTSWITRRGQVLYSLRIPPTFESQQKARSDIAESLVSQIRFNVNDDGGIEFFVGNLA